jgi:hypothetical protein
MSKHKPTIVFIVVIGCCCGNYGVDSYKRTPCTGSAASQFQFPGCYIPDMNTSLLLSEASFLMAHNAATGYIQKGSTGSAGLTWRYSKNQVGSVYEQLNNGARALDLRPKLLANGTVIFQHDAINIFVSFERLLTDAVNWCGENNDELVLLLPSNFAYQSSTNDNTLVSAVSSIYNKLGITYAHCNAVYGLTVAKTMELAALPSGGFLLALDGQDYYGTFCGKSNWVQSQLVMCRNASYNCVSSSEPLKALKSYVVQSANNDATDDFSILGPPVNLYNTPFNEIQALWQVDTYSAASGVSRLSSILDDNTESKINQYMVKLIHGDLLNAISLFAVDNVALNGNAMLSVLRNTCGQSDLEEPSCGQDLSLPRMAHFHISRPLWLVLMNALVLGVVIVAICRKEDKRLFFTLVARCTSPGRCSKHSFPPSIE